MSPTPNIAIWRTGWLLAMFVITAACGESGSPDAAAPCVPPAAATAPTYSELFTKYFAPGTPGHCATDGCHAGADYNVWLCGLTKDSCYQGMTIVRLIDPENPTASQIADPGISPLSWINPSGPMPYDVTGSFPEGRDAILAWVAACAQND